MGVGFCIVPSSDLYQPQTLYRCLNTICKMDLCLPELLGLDTLIAAKEFQKAQHRATESQFLMITLGSQEADSLIDENQVLGRHLEQQCPVAVCALTCAGPPCC